MIEDELVKVTFSNITTSDKTPISEVFKFMEEYNLKPAGGSFGTYINTKNNNSRIIFSSGFEGKIKYLDVLKTVNDFEVNFKKYNAKVGYIFIHRTE